MLAMTWVFEETFNTALIKKAKGLALPGKLGHAKIIDDDGAVALDKDKRVSKVCFLEDVNIRAEIWSHILKANANNFGFDIIKNFQVQFGEYSAEYSGFYEWHLDQGLVSNKLVGRKLSIVVQLTDPSEYEGGKLEFDIDGEQFTPSNFEKKGSVIVFPSFYRHRVTPVTKGVRNSLVAWVDGPNFR